MALNLQNLKTPTSEEARERGKKGGQKSAETRQKRKLLKDELLALLEVEKVDIDGIKKTAREIMSAKLVARAIAGDIDAYKTIRDTIGEKPTDKVDASVTTENQNVLKDYLEAMKHGGG